MNAHNQAPCGRRPIHTLMGFFLIMVMAASDGAFGQSQSPAPGVDDGDAAEAQDPTVMLARVRTIYVNSHTEFVKAEMIANELRKRPEFKQLGLVLTNSLPASDLTLVVRRSIFTTSFPYAAHHTRNQTILATGKVNSIGGTVAAKVAKDLLAQIQAARRAVYAP